MGSLQEEAPRGVAVGSEGWVAPREAARRGSGLGTVGRAPGKRVGPADEGAQPLGVASWPRS